MIEIDYLDNHPCALEHVANMWCESTRNVWTPEATTEYAVKRFSGRVNDKALPLTLLAFHSGETIGTCSIDSREELFPEYAPWLCALVVAPEYRNKGIGTLLIEAAKDHARALGYEKLYLGIFKPDLERYYEALGWTTIRTVSHSDKEMIIMEVVL